MGKQQTAVEWLVDNIHYLHSTRWEEIIEEAKEMEEKQITDAWEDGKDSFSTRNAKQYYNETFKK